MVEFILWYLFVGLIGLVTFPILFGLFPGLPGRGYGFSKVAGLLLWGFGYWLLGSLNLVRNDVGGALISFGILLALAVWAWRWRGGAALRAWIMDHRRHIIVVEVLFLGAFAAWTLVRAANPAIFGTEKPMELAFINTILQSPDFPPRDPWLSGYAISYYYFGYLITASIARLTGVTGGIAFNLAISMVFALGAVASYTLLYDLLTARKDIAISTSEEDRPEPRSIQPFAFLGPVFVLLLSNLVGLLEVLHARGLLWIRNSAGDLSSPFWSWLDLHELSQPPGEPFSWLPRNFGVGSWWWWRASRVVQDYDLSGNWREVIDEFPAFSFLLGDLHPHVLAIPFIFLGIALALNLYLKGADGRFNFLGFKVNINLPSFLFAAVVLGGLGFLNIWDFPTFAILFSAAYALLQINRHGLAWRRLGEFIGVLLLVGVAGYLIYLPWHLSFASQARGIIPNLIYPTRGTHLWIMFGLFLIPMFGFLLFSYRRWGNWRMLGRGFLIAGGLILALLLFSLLFGGAILSLSSLGTSLGELSGLYLGSLGAGSVEGLFGEALNRRLANPGGWLTLLALLGLSIGLLWPSKTEPQTEDDVEQPEPSSLSPFVLLLIFIGGLIVLAPEFVYLLDQFGWRINTIFKLYYQAWLIWAIAAAASLAILATGSRLWKIASGVGLALILMAGLLYPFFGIWDRAQGFQPAAGYRLDGALDSPYLRTEDRYAVEWLGTMPEGILAEAIGGSYTEFGRIAAHSGYPTVLGWPGHESQWRGGGTEMGSREFDIENLYTTRDWLETLRILDLYDIRYVYVGAIERDTYDVYEVKFRENLQTVYEYGGVTIYEMSIVE